MRKVFLSLTAVLGMAMMPQVSSAAPSASLAGIQTGTSLVEQATYYRRHYYGGYYPRYRSYGYYPRYRYYPYYDYGYYPRPYYRPYAYRPAPYYYRRYWY